MKKDRIKSLEEFIVNRKSVSMDDLQAAFPVSLNTIRRDLRLLQDRGLIHKVYGGVVYNGPRGGDVFHGGKPVTNIGPKKIVGALAARCVEEGDVVFIDSGTTTPWVVDYLEDKPFTIVTANLQVLVRASMFERVCLTALPGTYMPSSDSFSGSETVEALSRYNITKAFMAARGYTLEHGVTVVSPWEFENKKMVMARARKKYLLIDADKFDNVTMLTFCPAADIDVVVTEKEPAGKFMDFFRDNGIGVIFPEE